MQTYNLIDVTHDVMMMYSNGFGGTQQTQHKQHTQQIERLSCATVTATVSSALFSVDDVGHRESLPTRTVIYKY